MEVRTILKCRRCHKSREHKKVLGSERLWQCSRCHRLRRFSPKSKPTSFLSGIIRFPRRSKPLHD